MIKVTMDVRKSVVRQTLFKSDGKKFIVCSPPFLAGNIIGRHLNSNAGNQEPGQTSGGQGRRFPVLLRYLRSLKWTPIPLSVGFGLIAYQHYRHVRRRESGKSDADLKLASDLEVACYRLLPLRTMSRAWGWVNEVELPRWARKPLLSLYVRSFGCDLSEATQQDLAEYRNLGEFFRRTIRSDVRPVDNSDCVVSPADGRILHFGKVKNNRMKQVKGVVYPLHTFLGPNRWRHDISTYLAKETPYQEALTYDKESRLFHLVVYLAPGDYHRFHSPVDWEVSFRRHFSGDLLSVNPGMARWISGLFNLNERVAYVGRWKYGFFSMTAVGATNVGSIKVDFDQELVTNCRTWKKGTLHDHTFSERPGDGVQMKKGDYFGEFNLGSTIVLVFEAPKDYRFTVEQGQLVKFGQPVDGCVTKSSGAIVKDSTESEKL